jgi:hypothetical protein
MYSCLYGLVRWINLGIIFDYQIINPLFLGGIPKIKGGTA